MKKWILLILILNVGTISAEDKQPSDLFFRAGAGFRYWDLWRGIDIPANGSPAVVPEARLVYSPFGDFLQLNTDISGNFALFGRGTDEHPEMTDRLLWRIFGDVFFFPEKWLECVLGFSLYENIYWPVTRTGAVTAEIFTMIRLPNIFLRPSFQIYWDLTPDQSGAYALFEVRQPFRFLEQDFEISGVLAYFAGFMKQDSFRNINSYLASSLKDIRYILPVLAALVPQQFCVRLDDRFHLPAGFELDVYAELWLTLNPYISHNQIGWVVGFRAFWQNSTNNRPLTEPY